MFDELFGLPVHPLVVHLTVVLVPVTAVTAIVFAAVVKWRWVLRLPLGLMAIGSLVTTIVSVLAGNAFLEARPELARAVVDHEAAGQRLLLFVIGFTVVALVATTTLGGPSALASGRGQGRGLPRPAEVAVAALLALVSAACLYQVIRTGELGARAVWGS